MAPERSPRLYLPNAGGLSAAGADTLNILDASGIAVIFELMEADITFDGLRVPSAWVTESQITSKQEATMVEQAINRSYPPNTMAGLRIEGIARAADAVRWLRALKLRTVQGPSKRTRLALVKE